MCLILACMLHPENTHRWLHCEYNQKLGAPVRSTLLDDFADGVASLQRLEGILIYLAR